jgi:hypothetical protein
MSGWLAMQREAVEHPLFRGNSARLGAWLWIISKAAWKPTPFDIQGRIVTLERGQLCVSMRQMADAWGWSKSAVDRFLARLSDEGMISREIVFCTRSKTGTASGTASGTARSVITVCNYAKYQDSGDWAGTARGTCSGTTAGQQRDIKEQGNKGTIPLAKANGHAPLDDPAKVAFTAGVSFLASAGIPEKTARSLIGRWRKEADDGQVIAALGKAQREGALDPVAFISGCLRALRRQQADEGGMARVGF